MFRLWRKRPILVSAFLLATALTLFFGFRFVRYTLYLSLIHISEPTRPY